MYPSFFVKFPFFEVNPIVSQFFFFFFRIVSQFKCNNQFLTIIGLLLSHANRLEAMMRDKGKRERGWDFSRQLEKEWLEMEIKGSYTTGKRKKKR